MKEELNEEEMIEFTNEEMKYIENEIDSCDSYLCDAMGLAFRVERLVKDAYEYENDVVEDLINAIYNAQKKLDFARREV